MFPCYCSFSFFLYIRYCRLSIFLALSLSLFLSFALSCSSHVNDTHATQDDSRNTDVVLCQAFSCGIAFSRQHLWKQSSVLMLSKDGHRWPMLRIEITDPQLKLNTKRAKLFEILSWNRTHSIWINLFEIYQYRHTSIDPCMHTCIHMYIKNVTCMHIIT